LWGQGIFNDGNKRTAIAVALEFCRSNNIDLQLDNSIIDIAVGIAEGSVKEEVLLLWISNHQS